MSVWLTIPSARPATAELDTLFRHWHSRGYKIALWRDPGSGDVPAYCDYARFETYTGYAAAVNGLIQEIMARDASAEWFIAAGDDVEPDLAHSAEQIAEQCNRHFAAFVKQPPRVYAPHLFGVMQPTGDRWGDDEYGRARWPDAPAYIDRICGSAWIGREFARRMYGGNGPLWHEYFHMYVDEELQNVAKRTGVLWQRRDLVQLHRHWGRKEGATTADIPPHLLKANSAEAWAVAQRLFERRRDAGFPGHEPIA